MYKFRQTDTTILNLVIFTEAEGGQIHINVFLTVLWYEIFLADS